MQREAEYAPQGALQQPDGSVVWRVWAPLSETVALVTYPPAGRVETAMAPEAEGYFVLRDPAAGEASRTPSGWPTAGNIPIRPPAGSPRACIVPRRCSFPQSYRWSDERWRGVAREIW